MPVCELYEGGKKRMDYWAHSKNDSPEKEWQPMEAHSRGVAELAHQFASKFSVVNIG